MATADTLNIRAHSRIEPNAAHALRNKSSIPPVPAVPPTPSAASFKKYATRQHARPPQPSGRLPAEPIDIEQEVARKTQLENENTAQDIKLKRVTLNRLFWFLAAETALIFLFAFCQAVGWPAGFALEEWSFRVLIGATIAQITGMLSVAVRYLFPKKITRRLHGAFYAARISADCARSRTTRSCRRAIRPLQKR